MDGVNDMKDVKLGVESRDWGEIKVAVANGDYYYFCDTERLEDREWHGDFIKEAASHGLMVHIWSGKVFLCRYEVGNA